MTTTNIKTVKSSGGDYTSLSNWEAGRQADLVALDYCEIAECYAFSDTTPLVFDGWTLNSTHWAKITVPSSERHAGVWDATKYRLEVGSNDAFKTARGWITLEWMQISVDTTAAEHSAIQDFYGSGATITVHGCIIKDAYSGGANACQGMKLNSYTWKIYNNIIYDFQSSGDYGEGIRGTGQAAYIFNNTLQNCKYGCTNGGTSGIYKNNLFSSCNTCFKNAPTVGAGSDANSTNNASLNYTVSGGGNTHDRLSQTFTFANEAGDNFHLASTDAGARDVGLDLSGDSNCAFSDDIDGQTRSAPWDIGTDEYIGAGAYTETLLSTINSASSVQDIQNFIQTLTSTIQSQSAIIDTIPGQGPYNIDSYPESNRDTFHNLNAYFYSYGQTFTGDGRPLDKCQFYLGRYGSPTNNVYAKLYEITGTFGSDSHPTGDPLAISDPVAASGIIDTGFPPGQAFELVTFTFSTPYTLVDGHHYALACWYEYGDSFNEIMIGADISSPTHPGNWLQYHIGQWSGGFVDDTIFYALTNTPAGGGIYTEVLTSIAVSASSIFAIQAFVEIVSGQIQSLSSLAAAQAYVANLISMLSSYSVVAAIQTYVAILNSTAQSVSSITDFKGQIESIRSTAISSSSIQDFQTYLEIRSDFIQSVSSLVDAQIYLNILSSIGVISTSLADYQKYVETAQTVIVSLSAISDEILSENHEILLSVIQSADSVTTVQAYFHNLLSTLHSLSSVTDQQHFIHNVLTLIQSHVSITDQQVYIHELHSLIISSSGVVDFIATPDAEYLLSMILSRAGVYDYLKKPGMAEAAIKFYMTPRKGFQINTRPAVFMMEKKN